MSTQEFPELSCYLLPGHSETPADAITEARRAEAIGLGRVWVSERFDIKDVGVICGAALAATKNITVATGGTNLHTRHPLVLATMTASLYKLGGGRFELGIARGVAIRNQLMGLSNVSNAQLAEGIELLRKLWRGEKVMGHEGEMGSLPYAHMGDWMDIDMPIHFVGFGSKSLRFAGAHFDGVHLHTFINHDGLRKARALIDEGAASVGKPPGSVKLWSVFVTGVNPSREDFLRKKVARMATYMQAPNYVEFLCELNGWDKAVLDNFRQHPAVTSIPGGIDSVATLEQLEAISELIPEEWFPAAWGTPEECAAAWQGELDNGADGIVLHGCGPDEIEPVLAPYRALKQGAA